MSIEHGHWVIIHRENICLHPYKKLNQTAKAVQSYNTISQVVQTVRCKAYLLNPDKYFSKLLTGYIPLTIVHQMSFSKFSTGAVQQFNNFLWYLTRLNRGIGSLNLDLIYSESSGDFLSVDPRLKTKIAQQRRCKFLIVSNNCCYFKGFSCYALSAPHRLSLV